MDAWQHKAKVNRVVIEHGKGPGRAKSRKLTGHARVDALESISGYGVNLFELNSALLESIYRNANHIVRHNGSCGAAEVGAIAQLLAALVAIAAIAVAARLVERAVGGARQSLGVGRAEVDAGHAAEVGAVARLDAVDHAVTAAADDAQATAAGAVAELG